MNKIFYIIAVLFLYIIVVMHVSSCAKEYSYEGGISDTFPQEDTIPSGGIGFPPCEPCDITGEMSAPGWHFQYANTLLCGYVTAAIITPERNAFTFFGPSACAADTGLVMTVYLENFELNRDTADAYAGRVVFQYYGASGLDILLSDQVNRVELIINSYNHATGMARGQFNGKVVTEDSTASIAMGRFTIQFQ